VTDVKERKVLGILRDGWIVTLIGRGKLSEEGKRGIMINLAANYNRRLCSYITLFSLGLGVIPGVLPLLAMGLASTS